MWEILTWWRLETDGVQLEIDNILFQINICWSWEATIHISLFPIYIIKSASCVAAAFNLH